MNPAEIVLFLSLGFLAGAWAVCIFLMLLRQPALSEDIQAVADDFNWLEVAHDAAQQARVLNADDDSIVGLLAIVAERDRELALSLAAALADRGSDLAAVIKRELSVGVFAEVKS
jgi:hypothetical protein